MKPRLEFTTETHLVGKVGGVRHPAEYRPVSVGVYVWYPEMLSMLMMNTSFDIARTARNIWDAR